MTKWDALTIANRRREAQRWLDDLRRSGFAVHVEGARFARWYLEDTEVAVGTSSKPSRPSAGGSPTDVAPAGDDSAGAGEPHLVRKLSDRGFARYPPLPSIYGAQVQVGESSGATHPALWLWHHAEEITGAQLTLDDALKLADQLRHAVDHHYQTAGAG